MFLDKSGNPWIAISEFHQQAYCEVQLKYKWAGIKKVTPEMKKGTEVHEKKLQKFDEKMKDAEQVDVRDAIKRAVLNGERFSARELLIRSPTFHLYGVIDSVEIGPEGIVITDDKPCDYAYMSAKSQVMAYGIAFQDFYRPSLELMVMIKNHDGDILWEESMTQELLEEMQERIQRLQDLALGKREFEPTKNPKKCKSCSYRNICDMKIIS